MTPRIRRILELARWAPSGDNSQPWRFEIRSHGHLVVHTRADGLGVYDLEGSAALTSVGAMLETMRVAASAEGCALRYDVRPQRGAAAPPIDVWIDESPGLCAEPLHAFIRSSERPARAARPARARRRPQARAGTGGRRRLPRRLVRSPAPARTDGLAGSPQRQDPPDHPGSVGRSSSRHPVGRSLQRRQDSRPGAGRRRAVGALDALGAGELAARRADESLVRRNAVAAPAARARPGPALRRPLRHRGRRGASRRRRPPARRRRGAALLADGSLTRPAAAAAAHAADVRRVCAARNLHSARSPRRANVRH